MSGVVGGAGSKSGVIGQTEIDYEEGTYTPSFYGTSGGPSGVSFATRIGAYTKVGNLCTAFIHINISSWSSGGSGDLIISLPFTMVGSYPASVSVGYSTNFVATDAPCSGYIASGWNYMKMVRHGGSDARSDLESYCNADSGGNEEVMVQATFRV
tara:strand:+ start:1746 stop:2210 length:465 start_codon:yes stop_codon:yes gene_type:complete